MNVITSQVTDSTRFTCKTNSFSWTFNAISRAFSTNVSFKIWIHWTSLYTNSSFKFIAFRTDLNTFLFFSVKYHVSVVVALNTFTVWVLQSTRLLSTFSCCIHVVSVSASCANRAIFVAWNTVIKSWRTELAFVESVNKAEIITIAFDWLRANFLKVSLT